MYDRKTFLKKTGLTEPELAQCEQFGLIKRDLSSNQAAPLYSADQLKESEQIAHFVHMGYSYPEIRKIIKKIGLPKREKAAALYAQNDFLTVGELADMVHVNNRTIKYWEERGIILPDRYTEGGFRLYGAHYIHLCRLIVDLQNFGYTLEQIKERADLFRLFIELQANPGRTRDATTAMAGLETMELRIQELYTRMKELAEGMERWNKLLKKKRKEITRLKAAYTSAKEKH
ncbi:MerR family transcriptional regulator [bacterium]|nr:MerR family transcriptional regulator [bacterium]